MELREYLAIGRKWLWLFVLASSVAATSAWVATQFMPRTFRSQTTLMVGRVTEGENPDVFAMRMTADLANTYAQMATRQPILEGAVEALGLQANWQRLRDMVKARAVPGTQLLEITVLDVEPQRAMLIANEVANQVINSSPTPQERQKQDNEAFVAQQQAQLRTQIEAAQKELDELEAKMGLETSARAIADLQSRRQARSIQIESWRQQFASLSAVTKGSQINSITVIEVAAPGSMVGPNAKMNVLLAALIGLGLALGAVLVMEYLDDTVKTTDQVERRLGLPGLATIHRIEDILERRDGLVTVLKPRSPDAEAFRSLRTNLRFSVLRKPHASLLITSAHPGEGKSSVAANLAVAIAQSGQNVVLLDADLRRPSLHRFFGLPNSLGMTSLLLDDQLTVEDALQDVADVPGLKVLTTGPLPPNPAEVLESPDLTALMARLRDGADAVIVDSPPLLVVTDAAILAGKADGTVLVVDSCTTRTDAARRAIAVLEKIGVTPVGAVVNKLDLRAVSGYYYYYRDRYRYDYGSYYGSSSGGSAGSGGGDDGPSAPGTRARHRPAPGWVGKVRQAMTSFLS